MVFQRHVDIELENFDDLWKLDDLVVIEKKFRQLLSQAEELKDKSTYLQILSQIALAQAFQKKFKAAHKTLDEAEMLLAPEYDLARARILLERGRVFQQTEKISNARVCFERSFELSSKNKFDYHTINAANMLAIVAKKIDEKIKWNQRALELALSTKDRRTLPWLGALYTGLGQNYVEKKAFEKALAAFQKALEYRKKEGSIAYIRIVQWSVAFVLRLLDRIDEALAIQLALLKEYDALNGDVDVPNERFNVARSWVYEELAELYAAKAEFFSKLADDDFPNKNYAKKIGKIKTNSK